MMRQRVLLILLAAVSLSAYGQVRETLPDFEEADIDGNGLLSFDEATQALPNLDLEDSNDDGWLNHIEIESAMPGLDLYGENVGGTWSVVGIYNYLKITDRIEGREFRGEPDEEDSES